MNIITRTSDNTRRYFEHGIIMFKIYNKSHQNERHVMTHPCHKAATKYKNGHIVLISIQY